MFPNSIGRTKFFVGILLLYIVRLNEVRERGNCVHYFWRNNRLWAKPRREREGWGVVTFSLNCPNCPPPPEFAYISLYQYKIIKLWLCVRSREMREELTYIGFCRREMVPELSHLSTPSRICICKSCYSQMRIFYAMRVFYAAQPRYTEVSS